MCCTRFVNSRSCECVRKQTAAVFTELPPIIFKKHMYALSCSSHDYECYRRWRTAWKERLAFPSHCFQHCCYVSPFKCRECRSSTDYPLQVSGTCPDLMPPACIEEIKQRIIDVLLWERCFNWFLVHMKVDLQDGSRSRNRDMMYLVRETVGPCALLHLIVPCSPCM
ncbi:hypothetical protein KP509_27G035200 [Ceratopteris richardii]|uniref:Uncharacterized protein n=1 Tax=Ceratopteris richardii TaxID=49495 RepID=A0A8T2RFD7_CERRI|nr:hypothetical protein KP509_27G035200 [Ceratopteris richardii]